MDTKSPTVLEYNTCWNNLCNKFKLKHLKARDVNYWIERVDSARIRYDELLKTLTLHPHDHAPSDDNPLSQAENSVWRQYLSDIDLKQIIKNDVVRIHHGFICEEEGILKVMKRILFCYAKKNEDISYKQGMHEILAFVILAMKRERFTFFNYQKQGYKNDILKKLYDPKYVEHDAYELFSCIMEPMKYFYDVDDHARISDIPSLSEPSQSILADELKYFQTSILSHYASDLECHLRKLNIEFTSFGIRWIRLLFGREFSLNTVLLIWDVIFAYDRKFSMIYYIFFAMLVWIRQRLLNGSYTECLEYLMRYPPIYNSEEMISFALRARGMLVHLADNSMKFVFFRKNNPHQLILPTTDLASPERTKLPTKYKNVELPSGKLRCKKASSSTPYSIEDMKRVRVSKHSRSFAPVPSEDLTASEALNSKLSALSLCRLSLDQCTNKLTEYKCLGNEEIQDIISRLNDISLALDNVNGIKATLERENSSMAANKIVTLTHQPPMICDPVVDPLPVTSHIVALNLPPPKSEVNMTVFKCTEQPTEGNDSKFPRENPLSGCEDEKR